MTDNVNKFNLANRTVGYKKGMQALSGVVNFREEFLARGIDLTKNQNEI